MVRFTYTALTFLVKPEIGIYINTDRQSIASASSIMFPLKGKEHSSLKKWKSAKPWTGD